MALDVDDVLQHIGQFGPYQIRILVLFLFTIFPITYQTLIMVFIAFEPPWMCAEGSASCLGTNFTNVSSAQVFSTATNPKSLYERRCSLNRTDWKFADYDLYDGPHLTIVNQFDLVCGRAFQAWLANSMLFFGWAVGAIVLGIISDKFGRQKVLFPSLLTVVIMAFTMAFAKAYWIVAVCRFVIGFFEAGCFITMFVLATELVGPEKRALAGTLVWIYFTVALLMLALKAYFIRSWRMLLILSSAPFIFIVVFWKFIPESVRWLLVNGRREEAREILEKVARANKKEIPKEELYVPVRTKSGKGFLELFKSWKLAKLSLIQCYAWFVNGMVYYGLSLSAGEFGGSIYLNFVLTSLVEVPANILVIHNCNRFGRKKTVVVHMTAAAISAVCVSFIPAGTDNKGYIGGRVTLGTLGKLFITTSFNAIYVFSAELFPTVVRNSGMGMVSVASRIGAAMSPFVVQMKRINPILPFALMGGLSFVAAVFCWILPETVGKRTAEVMDDSGNEQGQERERKMNVQLLVLAAFTTATVKIARSLECYKCNGSWSATMCFKLSRIETCQYRPESVCMAVDAPVTNLKGVKSILFVRQCTSKTECHSSQPCKDIKLHLWKEKSGLLVEPNCRPQCCSSDYCNHPVPTLNLPKSSTRKILPTTSSRKSPKKCFKMEPEFVSKSHHGSQPREKNCSTNSESDACFTLRAQVFDMITRNVIETAEWKDCATESRDCHAIDNRCSMLRELARSRGDDVENCDVRCCKEDLCNAFMAISFPTFNQLEIIANRARRTGICEQSLLLKVILISVLVLRV